MLGKSNLIKKANRMRTEKRSQPQIKNGDILLTMIGLMSLGKSDFENVNEFHKDEEFYKRIHFSYINSACNINSNDIIQNEFGVYNSEPVHIGIHALLFVKFCR